MYRYLIHKNPSIILYLLVAPLYAVTSSACAAALGMAIEYANGGDLSEVWNYVLIFGAYILVELVVDVAHQAARFRVAERTMTALRADVYNKLSRMCYLHFFQRNSADYISNMTTDAEMLRSSYFAILLDLYSDTLRFIVALSILVWISPIIGAFVLVTSVLQTLVPILYAKKLERAGEQNSDAQERHMNVLKENLSAFLTAKVFHIEDKLEQSYDRASCGAEKYRRRMRILKEWTNSLSFVFSRVTQLGTFLLGAVLTIKGVITTAEVVAASELIIYISYPVLWLNGELADLRTAKASAKKLQAILDEPEDLRGKDQLKRPSGHIQVRDLRFGYSSERDVLQSVSYDFQQGKKYLIVGASGCGKSTFLNLVAGLRSDYDGAITLGSTEIRQLSRESLTQSLCVLNQEPFLFDDTLYNNVCLYEKMDEGAVRDALCRVGLKEFLERKPEGIHTLMGENAAAMSGGEKQRVVIARALVRGTPVLLLDESTSHLDRATAAGIERLVLGLEGVTVLLVSHNATETAKELADEILEMGNGRLQKIA